MKAARFRRPSRWLAAAAAVAVLAVAGLYGARARRASAATGQPIAFSHEAMVQAGIPCLFCHSGAIRSPAAAIPSVQRCMGCHDVIATRSPEVAKLAEYWSRQQPIPWVRLNRLPRFVYFSHRAHVVAGAVSCETCHGDVGHMTTTTPIRRLNMGWCLGCHGQQPNARELVDCVVCHQ